VRVSKVGILLLRSLKGKGKGRWLEPLSLAFEASGSKTKDKKGFTV